MRLFSLENWFYFNAKKKEHVKMFLRWFPLLFFFFQKKKKKKKKKNPSKTQQNDLIRWI